MEHELFHRRKAGDDQACPAAAGAAQGGDPKAPIGSIPFGKGAIGKMPKQKGNKKMLYELR